jgi:hypothetical protein
VPDENILGDGSPRKYWFLASASELERFVAAWQARTLPKPEWTHAAHVTIAAYHVIQYPESALERVRTGIIRYNEAVGTANTESSGYHETLTRLWLGLVGKLLENIREPVAGARLAVETFANRRDLFRSYYSFDVVKDTAARRTWIAPDLQGPYELSGALLED